MTRYMVIWHGITTRGATSERIVKQYFLLGTSERAVVDKARDIMRNAGIDPDGVPEVRRAEPGDESNTPEHRHQERTGDFYRGPDQTPEGY